ncbi:MAG: DedA family protein [Gammaproteobacteria bacterium]|nr:DedA family protein [Gammaproteobacteria bacterium]
MFRKLYDFCIKASQHKHADRYLVGVSVAEASFFPIPVDVMLAPMVMADRDRAWYLAIITTVASVIGGLIGYFIGGFFFESIAEWLEQSKYWGSYQTAVAWFDGYGFWAMLLAGFSPIPFKVFTIAAGTVSMPLLPFLLACIVGRGARYGLVAGLVKAAGPAIEEHLLEYIDRIGWGLVVVSIIAWLIIR